MPIYTNVPPHDPRGVSLPLKRTPANKPLVAVVTSEDLVGTPTHFWGGRTIPCEPVKCEACLAGISWLWHGYLAAYQVTQKLHFLFETTARGARPFVDYRKANGTLRGCLFEARRMHATPNGRVFVQTKTADLEKVHIPEPPDLAKVLAIIWNLAAPGVNIHGVLKDVDRVEADSTKVPTQWPSPIPDQPRLPIPDEKDTILNGGNHEAV